MILFLRHEMREDAQGRIVRCWEKFQAPKKVAKLLIERTWPMSLADEPNAQTANAMDPYTANIMEYNVKVLSGKEDPEFWKEVLEMFDYELWVNEYTGGPGAEYYKRNEAAYNSLSQRFGCLSQWQILHL